MKILTSDSQFKNAKSRDLINLECQQCHKSFTDEKHNIQWNMTRNKKTSMNCSSYCSNKCKNDSQKTKLDLICTQCSVSFKKGISEMKKSKSGNHFCGSSCACTYNNTHKTHGYRRSKLEVWLEQKLPKRYPSLEFHLNSKDSINSELDIYIPSLKLAFELNGIFHYEPIYSKKKLKQTQNNDERKFQACIEKGIELCIVDTSKQKYFKEQTATEFLSIIAKIIVKKTGGV